MKNNFVLKISFFFPLFISKHSILWTRAVLNVNFWNKLGLELNLHSIVSFTKTSAINVIGLCSTAHKTWVVVLTFCFHYSIFSSFLLLFLPTWSSWNWLALKMSYILFPRSGPSNSRQQKSKSHCSFSSTCWNLNTWES